MIKSFWRNDTNLCEETIVKIRNTWHCRHCALNQFRPTTGASVRSTVDLSLTSPSTFSPLPLAHFDLSSVSQLPLSLAAPPLTSPYTELQLKWSDTPQLLIFQLLSPRVSFRGHLVCIEK